MGTGRPYLKDVSYDISAVCSACRDTLLARLVDKNYDAEGPNHLRAKLEEVFDRHLAEKHQAKKS